MTDKQRIAALEKALAPFAREAAQWADTVNSRYRPGVTEPRHRESYNKAEFSVGDCRRAAKLLGK
jgi:hypothetical protein